MPKQRVGTPSGAYVSPSVALHAPTGVAATDTANLYQALNDTADGGRLWLPSSDTFYAYDPSLHQLQVAKNITIEGDSAAAITNGSTAAAYPYVKGSVLQVVTAGYDGIQITGTAVAVNLKNLGVLFANGLASTGHGIYGLPAASGVGSYYTGGIEGFRWDNVYVANHDGNHYGVYLVNPLLGTVSHLWTVGGGGLRLTSNSSTHYYGNIVFTHSYVDMLNNGTAHGYAMESITVGGTGLNLLTFIRPQCELGPSVANTQLGWTEIGDAASASITVIAPDIETSGTQKPAFGAKTVIVGDRFFVGDNLRWTSFGKGAFPWNNTATGAAFGDSALAAATTGTNNTAVGGSALKNVTTGTNNTAVGANAGSAVTTITGLTAVGNSAAQNATVLATAVGNTALNNLTTGTGNTAVGSSALQQTTTGQNNTAVGAGTLTNTTGSSNTAVGSGALNAAFSNGSHVAVGFNAMQNYTGSGTGSCVAVGFGALSSCTASAQTVAVGASAGVTATAGNATTTGGQQTLIGFQSGQSTATQLSKIVCVGYQALAGGNNAVAIGAGTSAGAAGSVALGVDNAGTAAAATTANTIVLGTALHTTVIPGTPAFVAGDKYLVVDSSGNVHKSALGPAS